MKRKILILIVVFELTCAGTIWAAGQDKNEGKVTTVAAANDAPPAVESKTPSLPATADPAYLIGPADVLDISVWKEPDVSRVVPVRPDGRISLPLINDVQAAGLSPQELAAAVTEKLRKFLNEPQVTIIVTAMNSQRVFIAGEVARPGAFPLLPGMTVLQALVSAGGFTPYAKVKEIHVMRLRDGKQIQMPFNYKDVLKGEKQEQNIKLEPGDTIVVP